MTALLLDQLVGIRGLIRKDSDVLHSNLFVPLTGSLSLTVSTEALTFFAGDE